MHPRRGFTLIELLVVIAIVAILAVVVVLTLNPAALLQQSRDANRLSDIDTITKALGLSQVDQLSLGNASTVYVSLPDSSILGAQTSTCAVLGLSTSSLPSGWGYQCSSPQDYRNTNGTGWIPVNFTKVSAGTPFGSLPVDPANQSSSGLYYTYTTNGGPNYEVTADLESQKNLSVEANSGGQYSDLYQKGNSLALLPVDYGRGSHVAQAATPTFSPVAGSYYYNGCYPLSVTISSVTTGATICYTTDGSTPTANGAGVCINGVSSSSVALMYATTVNAIASKSGYIDSTVGSAIYTTTRGPCY